MPKDTRLIERWLPIAELGEESVRERRSMTALPPIYYLHVWWARRPLIASRAAILASVLPADADHTKFLHALGIHGDPVTSRRRIDRAKRSGERFEGDAYSYPRAFSYSANPADCEWLSELIPITKITLLDPTAGGGSIPFEAARIRLPTFANELNPVAALILRAIVDYPIRFGKPLVAEFERLAKRFLELREERLLPLFPVEPYQNAIPTNFIWARTITCPYCEGLVPLSPNWRLASDGTGVRIRAIVGKGPGSKGRRCTFEIVKTAKEHSAGTVADGDATCPFPDCGRVIDGDEVKRQAQAGQMDEQLYAVVFKQRVEVKTKTGKVRSKWERGYRAPRPEDDNGEEIKVRLAEKMPEWEALDVIPSELIDELSNYDRGHRLYGATQWRDMFSPRQLFCHGTGVEIFRQLLEADQRCEKMSELSTAAFLYLALALDTTFELRHSLMQMGHRN